MKCGQKAIRIGQPIDGILQIVRGTFRVEVDVPGRPQALVLGRLGSGEILGELTWLMQADPTVRIVCESEEAATIRLPNDFLIEVFDRNASLAAKFYAFIATRAAERLQRAQQKDWSQDQELTMDENVKVPTTIAALWDNPAFFFILNMFVDDSEDHKEQWGPVIEFAHEVRGLRKEGVPAVVAQRVQTIHAAFFAQNAQQPISAISVSESDEFKGQLQTATEAALSSTQKFTRMPTRSNTNVAAANAKDSSTRHVYDETLQLAMAALERNCMPDFLGSRHYQYIVALRLKEKEHVTMDYFKIVRMLGEGAFGQVLEVVKRDCGKRYAMKVMEKQKMYDTYGSDTYEETVVLEKNLMAQLYHPLFINLAYSFQNINYLVLVMDACYGGDLEPFGFYGKERLTTKQVHFVGLEVLAMLCFLHSKRIMFRDLKPANLLLDEGGHLRLVDFGIAKQAAEDTPGPPTSTADCGSRPYVAPEVGSVTETGVPYGVACDFFSFGVMLYELKEKKYPFGEEPKYENVEAEFVQPELVDESGHEVLHMYDLVAGLLDWAPTTRLGGSAGGEAELRNHAYWGVDTDWELVEARRMPSPMKLLVEKRIVSAREREEETSKRSRISLDFSGEDVDYKAAKIAERMEDAQRLSKRADAADDETANGNDRRLMDMDAELSVEGWEFVSEHALAQEYVENASTIVSII